jgi:hypothetical protein
MKRLFIVAVAVWAIGVGAPSASGGPILFEWAVNQDGTVSDSLAGGSLPGNWNDAGFDVTTGLGTLSATISGAGLHSVRLFLDIEIDEVDNGFSNEFGDAMGVLATGQSWEIDEPGYDFGNIFNNFTAGTLDNTNAVPASAPDDVSFALGWALTLDAGTIGIVTFTVSATAPTSGFYLVHTDPDSDTSIYFASNLAIRDEQIPEPATLLLLGTGLLMLGARARRR